MFSYSIFGKIVSDTTYIFLRINSDGKYIRLSTGVNVPSGNFDSKSNSIIKKGSFDYMYHRELLNSILSRVDKVIKIANTEDYDFIKIKNAITSAIKNQEIPKQGVLEIFKKWATVPSAQKLNPTRQNKYSYNIFKEFLKNQEISFSEVDYNLYNNYVTFLRAKNLKENTIGNHIKNLKAVMNYAYKQKLHNNLEFRNFVKPKEKIVNINLTELEIERIYMLQLHGQEEKVRDIFILGCYVAQRFSDYSRINYNDIINGNITILQNKTKHRIIIPVHPVVKEILDKYNGELPQINMVIVNRLIKEVAKKAGINDKILISTTKGGLKKTEYVEKYKLISTHTARKSGVTNALRAGVPIEDCMYLAGINNIKTFRIYAGMTDEEYCQRLSTSRFFTNDLNPKIIDYAARIINSNYEEKPKWLQLLIRDFENQK